MYAIQNLVLGEMYEKQYHRNQAESSGALDRAERIEAQELEAKDMFPLSELKVRVTHYVKENDITIDTFLRACDD